MEALGTAVQRPGHQSHLVAAAARRAPREAPQAACRRARVGQVAAGAVAAMAAAIAMSMQPVERLGESAQLVEGPAR